MKNFDRTMRKRRGAVLITVLVLLLIASSIAGAILQAVLRDARQFNVSRNAFQADRLSEVGLALGKNKLVADPSYRGEDWTATLPDGAGLVGIRVVSKAGRRSLVSVGIFPADAERPARSRRTILLED